ncbi:MAG: hypothetical protein J6V90_08485 [Treponema sp.]|nr:hypothetical protein [Treponema sp.]
MDDRLSEAFERFSIMTIEGRVSDEVALNCVRIKYGNEIGDKLSKRLLETGRISEMKEMK